MRKLYFIITLLTISFIIRSQNWQWAKNVSYSFTPNGNHLAAGESGNFYMSTNSNTIGACLSKFDIMGNEIWRNYISGSIAINAITCSSGFVFIAGSFENTVQVGSYTLTSSGSHDAFIACAKPGGVFVWAKHIGGTKEDYGNDICSDKKGNIYITGQYSDTVKFGASTFVCQGTNNMFIIKLDKTGNALFSKSAGSKDSLRGSEGTKIKVDSLGNIFVFGAFTDIILDTCHIAGGGPYGDQYFCKLDSNGSTQWLKLMATFTDKFCDMELDASCNILGAGSGGWTNGGWSITRKHTPMGQSIWSKGLYQWHDGYYAKAVATDGFNSFIVGGAQLHYHPDWTSYNFFLLAKYDSAGVLQYNDTIKTDTCSTLKFADGADIIRDSNGDYIIVGGMKGTFNLGVYSLTTPNAEVFIAKFSDTKIITDIASKKQDNGSTIYPNPSSGVFTVSLKDRTAKTQICVRDVLGNCILSKNYQNETDLSFDLSNHSKGIYFVEIISDQERTAKKVVLE
jgi:hypothetical protein